MANDIILNDLDEIKVQNGDFFIGTADEQHVDLIIRSDPGDVKDYPLLGVGISNFINGSFSSSQADRFKREIRLQLESDGAKNVKVKMDTELNVSANYE